MKVVYGMILVAAGIALAIQSTWPFRYVVTDACIVAGAGIMWLEPYIRTEARLRRPLAIAGALALLAGTGSLVVAGISGHAAGVLVQNVNSEPDAVQNGFFYVAILLLPAVALTVVLALILNRVGRGPGKRLAGHYDELLSIAAIAVWALLCVFASLLSYSTASQPPESD